MRLLRLQLFEFRNFARQEIQFRPQVNFLLGENGQGKTNLLEAIYLLCRGTSFRVADAESLLRHSPDQPLPRAKLQGHFLEGQNGAELDYNVEMLLEAGRKTSLLNEKRISSAALAARFPIVLFSPESLSVIKDGPDARRRLIDEIMLTHDPRQARLQKEFSRALKARNRLLRNLQEGLGSRRDQEESLSSLNKIYLLLATHITQARLRALNDLQPDVENAMRSILDESSADISVDYLISSVSAGSWSEVQIFDALQKRQQELSSQEIQGGTSLVGPHKHDIKLLLSGNDSRFYCSQGQQRALILALKIAQIVYHRRAHQTYPLLLLDDVMSELDAKKRVNLMKFLEQIAAQILITATDLTWPEKFGTGSNSVFAVVDGHVSSSVE